MPEGQTDIRLLHHMADGDALREIPPHLGEGFGGGPLTLVLALAVFQHAVIAVVALQPARVISGGAQPGGEGKIGVAVHGNVQTVQFIAVDLPQNALHLTEAAHGTDVGDLNGDTIFHACCAEFVDSIKNTVGIVPDMGGNQLLGLPAAFRRPEKFVLIRTGDIAQAEGNAHAAAVQGGTEVLCHLGLLGFRRTGIDVLRPCRLAEIFVARVKAHIDGNAVPVGDIQVFHGIIDIDAAVAAHGGGNTLAEHHVENAGLNFPVLHRILVEMDIDKAGSDDFSRGIDVCIRLGHRGACPGNFSVFNQQIQQPIHPVGRVDDMTAIDQCPHGILSIVLFASL